LPPAHSRLGRFDQQLDTTVGIPVEVGTGDVQDPGVMHRLDVTEISRPREEPHGSRDVVGFTAALIQKMPQAVHRVTLLQVGCLPVQPGCLL
jgi:hypothetical protein